MRVKSLFQSVSEKVMIDIVLLMIVRIVGYLPERSWSLWTADYCGVLWTTVEYLPGWGTYLISTKISEWENHCIMKWSKCRSIEQVQVPTYLNRSKIKFLLFWIFLDISKIYFRPTDAHGPIRPECSCVPNVGVFFWQYF